MVEENIEVTLKQWEKVLIASESKNQRSLPQPRGPCTSPTTPSCMIIRLCTYEGGFVSLRSIFKGINLSFDAFLVSACQKRGAEPLLNSFRLPIHGFLVRVTNQSGASSRNSKPVIEPFGVQYHC